ncbi:MAG: hypothetical protein E7118_00530 [Bacteroidales bacterium]|nr:hypothetical protein [Bacteroidales bacterium]
MKRIRIYIFAVLTALFSMGTSHAQEDAPSAGIVLKGMMESLNLEDVRAEKLAERLDFYASAGLNTYFYAPVDDVARTAKGWKFLYSDREKQNLHALMQLCKDRNMEFVWTVDPGNDYKWDESDYNFLKNKLVIMYHEGVRSFALAFSGADAAHDRMGQLKNRLDEDFVSQRREPVSLLVMQDMCVVDYPSVSADPRRLLQGIDIDEKVKEMAERTNSVICNMHERSELSKLSVITLADFAASPASFDPAKSREKAVEMLVPEVKDAYITFMEHSSVESESAGLPLFSLKNYDAADAAILMEEFRKIEEVPGTLESCASKELIEELKPWLAEFGKLGTRCRKALECLAYYMEGDLSGFWISYIGNIMSEQDKESYRKYKSGSVRLQPFYEELMDQLAAAFSEKMTGGKAMGNLDFLSSTFSEGRVEYKIPKQAAYCRLLTGPLPEGGNVFLRQLASDGSLVAEFVVKAPYTSMEIKNGAVKVDVLGKVEIFETIFVSL